MFDLFSNHRSLIEEADFIRTTGRVVEVVGLTVVAEGLALPVGHPLSGPAAGLGGDGGTGGGVSGGIRRFS